jgi:hypothetical protein
MQNYREKPQPGGKPGFLSKERSGVLGGYNRSKDKMPEFGSCEIDPNQG